MKWILIAWLVLIILNGRYILASWFQRSLSPLVLIKALVFTPFFVIGYLGNKLFIWLGIFDE